MVIIGSGIAGLMSAAMLLHHAKKVIVIERAKKPEEEETTCKHGRQPHSILHRGRTIIEKIFPGFGTS